MVRTAAALSPESRVTWLVCTAHMLSHIYMLVLPPLFPLLKTDFGVSYTELGLAIAGFGLAAGLGQTPVGFLVDRIGARPVLVTGLLIEAGAVLLIGFADEFWHVLVLYTLAGVGHTVFHPADYALLSAAVPRDRLGRAYGVHSFTGNVGSALAPVIMVACLTLWNWRVAFIAVGMMGLVFALMLARERAAFDAAPRAVATHTKAKAPSGDHDHGIALLLSFPIMMCFLYFVLLQMGMGGIRTFFVAANTALYETPLATANAGLTGFLVGSAAGILAGGYLADRVGPRIGTAIATLVPAALLIVLIGEVSLPHALLVVGLTVAGALQGLLIPSRDLLVRSVTPDNSVGKVMGFVSSGGNLGLGAIPLVFGFVMDTGDPRVIFWVSAAFVAVALFTFIAVRGRSARG